MNNYLYFVNKYPAIRHYLFKTKPIYDNTTNREDWWYFASKAKYYYLIKSYIFINFNK